MLVLVAALISAWPELPLERHSPAAARSDVAVIAGIDDYFMLPDIDGAADSATDWFRFFVDTQGVPAERVFLLRNADVTKELLMDVTRKAATLAGPTDTLWVVVVGHGVPGTDGDGVFLTVDTRRLQRQRRQRQPRARLSLRLVHRRLRRRQRRRPGCEHASGSLVSHRRRRQSPSPKRPGGARRSRQPQAPPGAPRRSRSRSYEVTLTSTSKRAAASSSHC